MRLIVCRDSAALAKAGADEVAAIVAAKPNASVVAATGNSPMGIYSELGARTARGQFDASGLRIFQLDEYYDLADNEPRSLFAWMDRDVVQPWRVPLQNVVRLKGGKADWRERCAEYDQAVKAAGGFDLAVLGIGPNGHLGYNEPGSHAHSPTRALLLSEASIDSSVAYGWERKQVPMFAITCGLLHLLRARRIVLVVSGAHKRGILEKALFGPIGPEVPASYLQEVADLVVICDEAAAPKQALDDASVERRSTVNAPNVVIRPQVHENLLLGVDGGNSKTVAVIAQKNGRILGWGRGGCGDMYGATPHGARQNVSNAVQAALSMAGLSGTASAAAFSMAGADWPEDYALLHELFRQQGLAANLRVVNDSAGALRAGSPQGWGVAVAAGTWAATAARARGGEWLRSAWQPGGGGGGLAHDALHAVYRAEMGLGPYTRLTERVLDFFKLSSVEAVLHFFTKREGPHPQAIHRLAPDVLDIAMQGDPVACTVVIEQARSLGAVAASMARQAHIDRKAFPLVLAGGIFRHKSQLMPNTVISTVRAHSPNVHVFKSELEPVAGAVMLAAELSGARCDRRFRERLKQTMPEPSFFAT